MIEMDDESITAKHKRIRGSHDLKYPANNSRCRQTCGHRHDLTKNSLGLERLQEHRCFLAGGHEEVYCKFSSECGELRVGRLIELTHETLADDGYETLAQHFES